MNIRITPRPLQGTLAAIPSKSDAHRAILCAALCKKPTELVLDARNNDIDATLSCLPALSAAWRETERGILIIPRAGDEEHPVSRADCGESGSTLRFLLPMLALRGRPVTVTGHGRLPQRPMADLTEQLRQHGCRVSADQLPITVEGPLSGGVYTLPGNVTSQYVTGLLLALPHAADDSEIVFTSPLQSAGYVDMTVRTMAWFGLKAEKTAQGYRIPGRQLPVTPGILTIEGDWSNAAFFLTAAHLGADVTVTGLDSHSAQPDRAILAALRQLGGEIDCSAFPDLVPILSAAAACTAGKTTRFIHAERLRIKESDRLAAMVQTLTALGARAEETPDGLIVAGQEMLRGGTVDGCSDHRIVMTAAIAALRCREPVTILGAEAVNKSYPGFFEHYNMLGGQADVLSLR